MQLYNFFIKYSKLPVLGPVKFKNEAVYLGQFKDGKRHGYGT